MCCVLDGAGFSLPSSSHLIPKFGIDQTVYMAKKPNLSVTVPIWRSASFTTKTLHHSIRLLGIYPKAFLSSTGNLFSSYSPVLPGVQVHVVAQEYTQEKYSCAAPVHQCERTHGFFLCGKPLWPALKGHLVAIASILIYENHLYSTSTSNVSDRDATHYGDPTHRAQLI